MGSQNSKIFKTNESVPKKKVNMTGNDARPVLGDESIMCKKKHGTSDTPVQKNLRWGCDWDTADRICNFNVSYSFRMNDQTLIVTFSHTLPYHRYFIQ